MKIKVLQLESWMTAKSEATMRWIGHKEYDMTCGGKYKQIDPVFNRPGLYLIGDFCWFEREDGTTYTYDASSFKYVMSMLDVECLNDRQGTSLAEIVAQGLSTKAQRNLLHKFREAKRLRTMYRNTRKFMLNYGRD